MESKMVAIISDPGSPIRTELHDKLRLQNRFDTRYIDADQQMESRLLAVNTDTILYDCPLLDKYELAVLIKIQNLKPDAQIIVLADQITVFSYRKIAVLKRTVTMQKPVQLALLKSLIEKSMAGERIISEQSPRFIIDELVRVLSVKTGLLIPTRMRNYSAGGAFLEYHGIALNVGDRIKMNLGHPGVDKETMEVQARVVWIRDGDHSRSPTRGVGVQFLGGS